MAMSKWTHDGSNNNGRYDTYDQHATTDDQD